MKLKNILIAVSDLERSRKFYHDLFGLDTVADLGGNLLLTEGLVLQEAGLWKQILGREHMPGGAGELFFEENRMELFLEKLASYPEPIRILAPLTKDGQGRRLIRVLDPDGHVIEVKERIR